MLTYSLWWLHFCLIIIPVICVNYIYIALGVKQYATINGQCLYIARYWYVFISTMPNMVSKKKEVNKKISM